MLYGVLTFLDYSPCRNPLTSNPPDLSEALSIYYGAGVHPFKSAAPSPSTTSASLRTTASSQSDSLVATSASNSVASPKPSSSLSRGATAGVGVGVALGVLAVGTARYVCYTDANRTGDGMYNEMNSSWGHRICFWKSRILRGCRNWKVRL